MLKLVRRILNPVVGYLLVLLGFVFLGVFVAALALQSEVAVVLGVALAASFGLAVMSFRNGSAKLAKAREAGTIGDNVSIWARPLRQEQIDGYYVNYRAGLRHAQPKMPAVLHASRPDRQKRQPAAVPARLSA